MFMLHDSHECVCVSAGYLLLSFKLFLLGFASFLCREMTSVLVDGVDGVLVDGMGYDFITEGTNRERGRQGAFIGRNILSCITILRMTNPSS